MQEHRVILKTKGLFIPNMEMPKGCNDCFLQTYKEIEEIGDTEPVVPGSNWIKICDKSGKPCKETECPLEEHEFVESHWVEKHCGNGWNEWVDLICPVCGTRFEHAAWISYWNYCPRCGSLMVDYVDEEWNENGE